MKAKAVLTICAVLLVTALLVMPWADASRLTGVSDELSSSAPSTVATQTVVFTNVTAIPAGGYIKVTIPTDFVMDAGFDYEEVTMKVGENTRTLAASPGASADGVAINTGTGVITITLGSTNTNINCSGDSGNITAGCEITLTLGTIVDSSITNPAKVAAAGTADIYTIEIETGSGLPIDAGDTKVAIQDQVSGEAESTSSLAFVVAGQAGGDVTPTATSIDYGELTAATPKTAIQRIAVTTNAVSGYTVTLERGSSKMADGSIDIDDFTGTNAAPTAWSSPNGTTPGVNTAWIGYHTSDATLGTGTAGRFSSADTYAGLSTTEYEVLYHSGPSRGLSDPDGTGYADITYKVEANAVHPTGDYTGLTLTYIVTPIY